MTPFDDTTFDAFHPDFTQTDQDIPSPWGMPAFEIADQSALGTFFDTFESFNSVVLPDFTGARVRAYNDIRDVTVHLKHLRRAFPNSAENDTSYFGQCPSTFDTQKLHRFGRIMNKKHVSNMAANAAAMQEKIVKTWRPNADKPTESVFIGLVGIDESAGKECGAITLDLLLRAGVLVEGNSGKWDLAENYLERRIYLVGDGKTVENMVKFVRDMQDRRITYSNASIQAEIFLKALSVVMTFPDDWHSGLNMAQTVFNYCYTGFLDEFQSLLQWKRINKEVSSCY
jgi:hypothetical protein